MGSTPTTKPWGTTDEAVETHQFGHHLHGGPSNSHLRRSLGGDRRRHSHLEGVVSFWGYWLLANCDNDLTINLAGQWLFPSEERELRQHAESLGVTVKGETRE